MLKESVPANYVMVDGLGVGDVKEVVFARQADALSRRDIRYDYGDRFPNRQGQKFSGYNFRGFIYLKESQDLLKQTRFLIRKVVEEATGKMHPINVDYVKESLKGKGRQIPVSKNSPPADGLAGYNRGVGMANSLWEW